MNKRLLHTAEWVIAAVAYAYLAYRLATYEHYGLLAGNLRAMGCRQWLALAACTALMPLNMLVEAWRWKTLVPMPLQEAQRQVYYSKLAGLVTPWRLGEYPARALLMRRSPGGPHPPLATVLSMGAVGSITMTAAIVFAGALALAFTPAVSTVLGGHYGVLLAAVGGVLVPALLFAPRLLRRWAVVSHGTVLKSLIQSLIRELCWCVQLMLALYALKATETSDLYALSAWMNMPVYYLLVTVTPNIPVVEAGVRGAWAIFLFGTPNAALAGVLLWAINTLLPCLAWPCIKDHA